MSEPNLNATNPRIVAASTISDVINAALADPDIDTALTKAFASAAHSPIGSLIGTVLAAILVHFGIAQPSQLVWTVACGTGAIVFGYAWSIIHDQWLKPPLAAA